jgi:hypothetical protein
MTGPFIALFVVTVASNVAWYCAMKRSLATTDEAIALARGLTNRSWLDAGSASMPDSWMGSRKGDGA